jgi:hypothetical protein
LHLRCKCRCEARDAVEGVRGGVVGANGLGQTGVHPYPYAQGRAGGPGGGGQFALSGEGGGQRDDRQSESGLDGIADHFVNGPALGLDRLAQDSVVARQGLPHRVGLALPQRSAALDVCKEKGNDAGRKGR